MSQQQLPFSFQPSGAVTSFQGAGVSASFESKKDQIQAELDLLTLQMAKEGIKVANTYCNGVTQLPFCNFYNQCR